MTTTEKLVLEIRELPDVDKLRLVDAILMDLNRPDAEIDRAWAKEARERWVAYKAGRLSTIPYEEIAARHRE
ncbi:MAG TPA: addiction module protein [Pyrinomonadaceae bacterium]|nr:addiction module protein [Pyrinomonadaceae bacterium]